MANVARLSQDMAQAKSLIGNATRDIERMAGLARTALGAIGVGISVAGLAALTKSTIDAMAGMKDLGQEAGTTAEAISRFDEPARKADSSVDAVAASIFKMSKAAIEARDPASTAAQALRSIGIATEELRGMKPDEMFEKVARQVAQYSDGIEKNAVMQELFGKSGREMSRVVAEIAEKTKLAATVTNEEAEAADRLGDQMVELQMNSEKLWRSIAAQGLPILNEMVKAFLEGTKQAGLLQGAINALSVAMGGDVVSKLAKYNAEIKELETAWADAVHSGAPVDEPAMRARLEQLRMMRDGLMSLLHAEAMAKQDSILLGGVGKKGAPAFDPEAAKRSAKETSDAWNNAFNDMEAGLKGLERAWGDMKKLSEDIDGRILKDLDKSIEHIGVTTVDAAENGVNAWGKMAAVWDDLGNRGAAFFQDLLFSGEKALDVLKRHLKSFLAELVAIFAKRWILQLGATAMGGSAALSAAAGEVGQGTFAGSIASGIGSFTGLSGFTEGVSMGFQSGVAAPGAMGEAIGAFMATPAGWVLAGIAAIAALAYAFRDKGENWRAQLGFGNQAQVYRTEGVFGPEGFAQIAGDDALNRQIQAFMVSTGAVDRMIAARLSQSQIDTIRTNLGGPYTTRTDGQPAEFAFGKGDENAGQALTLEYLQKKYGTIFDQIDTTFATFIRGYTGKSEDLFKEIAAFVQLMESLAGTGIKGFDIAALRAMQREGEEIGATFQRVGEQWATFNDLFTTEAERIDAAQMAITTTFGDLGMAIPSSMDAFEDLVRGLDLSTEAGRKMFEALMAIAPAFAGVAQAAARSYASLQQTIGSILGPGYAQANSQSAFDGAVASFQGGNAWAAGLSPQALVNALLTISGPDWANYSAANQQLITTILNSYAQLQGPAQSAAASLNNLGNMANYAGDGFNTAGDKSNLRDWVSSKVLDDQLSPLTIDQRFGVAQSAYMDLLATANLPSFQGTGKAEAISKLQGAADTYLELARLMFGSSGSYNAIFSQVLSEVGGVGGMSQTEVNAKLYGALPTSGQIMSSGDATGIRSAIYDMIMEIASGAQAQIEASREGARIIAEEVRQTANTGRLA